VVERRSTRFPAARVWDGAHRVHPDVHTRWENRGQPVIARPRSCRTGSREARAAVHRSRRSGRATARSPSRASPRARSATPGRPKTRAECGRAQRARRRACAGRAPGEATMLGLPHHTAIDVTPVGREVVGPRRWPSPRPRCARARRMVRGSCGRSSPSTRAAWVARLVVEIEAGNGDAARQVAECQAAKSSPQPPLQMASVVVSPKSLPKSRTSSGDRLRHLGPGTRVERPQARRRPTCCQAQRQMPPSSAGEERRGGEDPGEAASNRSKSTAVSTRGRRAIERQDRSGRRAGG